MHSQQHLNHRAWHADSSRTRHRLDCKLLLIHCTHRSTVFFAEKQFAFNWQLRMIFAGGKKAQNKHKSCSEFALTDLICLFSSPPPFSLFLLFYFQLLIYWIKYVLIELNFQWKSDNFLYVTQLLKSGVGSDDDKKVKKINFRSRFFNDN